MRQSVTVGARRLAVAFFAALAFAQSVAAIAQQASPQVLPLPPTRPKALGVPAATPAQQPAPPAAAPAPPPAPVAVPVPEPPLVDIAGKINLNGATAEQLATLPDIGRARQILIIAERGRGRYKNWDDFARRMQGTAVDAEVLAKIKDAVSF